MPAAESTTVPLGSQGQLSPLSLTHSFRSMVPNNLYNRMCSIIPLFLVYFLFFSSMMRSSWWVSTRSWRMWQRTSSAWPPSTTCAPTTRRPSTSTNASCYRIGTYAGPFSHAPSSKSLIGKSIVPQIPHMPDYSGPTSTNGYCGLSEWVSVNFTVNSYIYIQ